MPSSFSIIAAFFALAASPQDHALTPATPLAVSVPAVANSTCPVMGKPSSETLFIDTELGRIYVCCPPCYKKVRANVAEVYQAAYPAVTPAENKRCPVGGEALPEEPATRVIQGMEIAFCGEDHAVEGEKRPQVTLAFARDPSLREVKNETCPVSDEPADDNLICRIGDELVHLSSIKHLAAVEADPAGMLAKAKASARSKPAQVSTTGGDAKAPAKTSNDG